MMAVLKMVILQDRVLAKDSGDSAESFAMPNALIKVTENSRKKET